jgi:hypothetical protein
VSIAVTPPAPSLVAGATEQFTATGTYSDQSTRDITGQVTWSSSAPAVATISAGGALAAAAAGTSTITASLDGVSGSTSLLVTPGASPVTITSLRVEAVKLGVRPHARRVLALVAHFSGAVGTAAAENLAAYAIFSGRLARAHRAVQTVFNKPVALARAVVDSAANNVLLIPRRSASLRRFDEVRVNASLLTDPQGRPINNGTDFEAAITVKGFVVSPSPSAAAPSASHSAIVDAALEHGGIFRAGAAPRNSPWRSAD